MDRIEQRRAEAGRMLSAMSDAEVLAAIEAQAHATWRQPDLVEHHRSHRGEWPRHLSEPAPSLSEYAEIAAEAARNWDRVFLAVQAGGPTWLFVRLVGDGSMGLIAVMRSGRIRSTMIASRLELWVQRQLRDHGAIEVTERGRNARQQH